MKEVYELWSFCIHTLRRTAPALAALAAPVVLAVLVALAVLVVLAVPVALVVLAVPAALVVLRPWAPQSPAWRRN
jgi:hypothetical protein